MTEKPAKRPRGESMNPEERGVEQAASKESWVTKLLRHARLTKGRPASDRKA